MEEKQVTVAVEMCSQIGPCDYEMVRYSRNFAITRPLKDMIAWAESMGVKDANINSLRFYEFTGSSV